MTVAEFMQGMGDMLNKYEQKAIYHSELYQFCKYAQDYDLIVESGTFHGFTAERLARIFPDKPIVSYEIDRDRAKVADKRCRKYENVVIIHGALKKISNPNCALLIDGPKGDAAIKMARHMKEQGVKLIAMHDMRDYIKKLKKKFGNVTHTGYPPLDVKDLDFAIPYKRSHHREGLYGKVLAFV